MGHCPDAFFICKGPEVFADGIVSVSDAKYITISFSGSIDEFYLYRWNGNKAEVLFSKIDKGAWITLRDADYVKGYKAMESHVTFDGSKVFFIWDKPLPSGDQDIPFRIWYTERTSEGWSEAKLLSPDLPAFHWQFSFAKAVISITGGKVRIVNVRFKIGDKSRKLDWPVHQLINVLDRICHC
jgi:hypothetical protein